MASSTGKGSKVPYRCSFCGKSQEQVRKLIAGQGVYICDECITLCQEIIDEEMVEAPRAPGKPKAAKLPNPRQIKESLDAYVISQERAKRINQSQFMKDIRAEIEKRGVIVLSDAWFAGGMASKNGCITKPDDMKGRKFRAAGPR